MFIFKSDKYIIPIEEIDFWENGIFDKDTKDQKKNKLAMNMINNAIDNVENNRVKKINAIWLETSGCFGEVISLLNSEDPNLIYMLEKFVDLQLSMHEKKAPRLTLQKDKFARKIESMKDKLDATVRYELLTRLDSMPNHTKLCHGDFNPSNVIVAEDGTMKIVDWSHATQGNASGDAAITYLEFALKDEKMADLYLKLFCRKSDTAKQYVQKWLPIAAAAQLTKDVKEEEEFLLRWTDIIDFQ